MDNRKAIRACGNMLESVHAKAVSGGMSKHDYHVEQLEKVIAVLRKIEKYF